MSTFRSLKTQYRCTRALTIALHARDEHTRQHCDRVVDLAARLAAAVGLGERSTNFVKICARFHDIGKLGIPDAVLLKPGRLTEDEWQIMKTHAEVGERIVRSTELPESERAALVIRHHHENYAGDGYPDGIKGQTIPVESRVILIVDAYDAMRSTRPNRPARSHDEVMAIMESENGWKFDPELFMHFPAIAEGYA